MKQSNQSSIGIQCKLFHIASFCPVCGAQDLQIITQREGLKCPSCGSILQSIFDIPAVETSIKSLITSLHDPIAQLNKVITDLFKDMADLQTWIIHHLTVKILKDLVTDFFPTLLQDCNVISEKFPALSNKMDLFTQFISSLRRETEKKLLCKELALVDNPLCKLIKDYSKKYMFYKQHYQVLFKDSTWLQTPENQSIFRNLEVRLSEIVQKLNNHSNRFGVLKKIIDFYETYSRHPDRSIDIECHDDVFPYIIGKLLETFVDFAQELKTAEWDDSEFTLIDNTQTKIIGGIPL